MELLDVQDIMEEIFTTPHPSGNTQPPDYPLTWVILENHTVFLSPETDELTLETAPNDVLRFALKELLQFGPPIAGHPSADFDVTRLAWYPDQYVYMVNYDHDNLFNIVQLEEEASEIAVGMKGRSNRELDIDALSPIYYRDFEGKSFMTKVKSKKEKGSDDG